MKNLLTTALILFSALTFSFAQGVEISEAPRAKENGTYNSFLFEIPDVSSDEAVKDWTKFMKDFKGKTKYDRKTQLYFTEEAVIPRLTTSMINVHARILEDANPNKRTSVIVWFDYGAGYINSGTDSLKGIAAKDLLTEYATLTSKHHAQSVVDAEEDRLRDYEKDLKKLKNANADFHSEVDKAKESIARNEKNIEINVLDQQNKEQDIVSQKKAVEVAKEHLKKFQ